MLRHFLPYLITWLVLGTMFGIAAALLWTRQRGQARLLAATRTRWRRRVRGIALAALYGRKRGKHDAPLWVELATLTDPRGAEDVRLVRLVRRIEESAQVDPLVADELVERVALLLKHDRDRAALAASWWPWRQAPRAAAPRREVSLYGVPSAPVPVGPIPPKKG